MKTTDSVARISTVPNEERLEELKQLFPECLSEGEIDFEKLKDILGNSQENGEERYHFTWAGKNDAIRLLNTPTEATLNPCRDNSLDFDNAQHIFIEGDNLEVLKILYKSYFGSIKVIYIDPPYNTGGEFIYRDNYTEPLNSYLRLSGQIDDEGKFSNQRY